MTRCCIISLILTNMQGQVITVVLLVLGLWLFYSVLLDSSTSPTKDEDYAYHLGCYDTNHPLNHSQLIQTHLAELSKALDNSSVKAVLSLEQQLERGVVRADGANEIASEFEKYIISYENIRSRNKYQQTFHDGLRKARDDFFQCRDYFALTPWECNETYESYLATEKSFEEIKLRLENKIDERFEHQSVIDKFLKDETTVEDEEYSDKYKKEREELANQLGLTESQLKKENQLLNSVVNLIFQRENQLNDTKKLLQDCKLNKKQIDYCKNITQNIKQIHKGINMQDIHDKIKKKRQIQQYQTTALAKTRILDEDVDQLIRNIESNNRELEQLQELYKQTQNLGLCANQINFKCSEGHIKELEQNITNFKVEVQELQNRRISHITKITILQAKRNQLVERIKKLDQDLQIKMGSFRSFANTQAQKIEQLRIFRQKMNAINKDIMELKAQLASIRQQRDHDYKSMDKILSRVGEIEACLGKKQFFLKLQSRKPKNAMEDERLKREAAQSLIAAIKKVQLV